MGVLKRNNNSLQMTSSPSWYIFAVLYVDMRIYIPLLQVLLFFASSNPALQEHVYNLSSLLQIWLHPPFFRRSQ